MSFKNKFIYITCIVLLCSFILFNTFAFAVSDATAYVWSNQSKKLETAETSVGLNSSSATVTNNPLALDCGAACLIEQSSGLIIYDYNMHEKLRPASVTKIMSLLLIMEALDSGKIQLTDKIPCTEDAAKMGGSQIWLDVRETLTVEEMLKAICVVSANDCVVAMADYLEGSQDAFVKKMNQKAQELGMNDTTFKNCHGIDEDGHLTSAYDIAIMSRELLMNHPSITKYTTIWMDSLRDGKSSLVNTNKLVRNYNGCTGLKTGSTSIALYNLSASATRNNLSLIAVVLKAPTPAIRFSNAQKLLDYGFSNYTVTSFGKKGDVIKSVEIKKGTSSSVDAILENDAEVLMSNGSSKDITQEIKLDDTFTAPILEGQKLGEVEFSINGNVVSTVNLVANKSSDKLSFGSIIKFVMNKWFNMLR
ncbi:MAG: D-alanyl-D-alanine carboxypeptidase [Clostridium sp.]|jgi:D-alanyl-D-alanine carboxypeptidase (penicillin-binding protein 5/6)|nr:MAG: D-alanyl-D-alanine carboxypeptidase [Clostridium sp.]